jgi:RNA polymerase sigma-70 factor, ECF subfamily
MTTIVDFPPLNASQALDRDHDRETKRNARARLPQRAERRRIDSSVPDEVLVGEIGNGDQGAMRVLFGRYQTRIYRFILRMVRDRALAEDLLSEVFLDAWRRAHLFAGRSAVSTWLIGIARHKALTALRARRMEQLDDAVALRIPDPSPDPEGQLAAQDRATLVRRSLDALTPEHREIIELVYEQEKSINEIAELLRISPNTVKTRMFYARKRLAALVAAGDVERACA